jgi:hypothetical protein
MNNKEIAEKLRGMSANYRLMGNLSLELGKMADELYPPPLPKPSWNDAPERARILVQNKEGIWYFGTHNSAICGEHWEGKGAGMWYMGIQGAPSTDWKNSMEFRPVPPKRVIDLTVLIESGIDCEVSDSGTSWAIIKLVHVDDEYYRTSGSSWNKCRPRMNHVHAWMGGKCPLPEGFLIKLYFRFHAPREDTEYHELRWEWKDMASDIIAFEVLGKADESWVYEWEAK